MVEPAVGEEVHPELGAEAGRSVEKACQGKPGERSKKIVENHLIDAGSEIPLGGTRTGQSMVSPLGKAELSRSISILVPFSRITCALGMISFEFRVRSL